MKNALWQRLMTEVRTGSYAYVRNLAVAETAVLRGQFNVAKVLRAAAHTQRILAMQAAHLLTNDLNTNDIFDLILKDLGQAAVSELFTEANVPSEAVVQAKLAQFAVVKGQLEGIVQRARVSLAANGDVLESDVAQFLWGCYGCGYLVEGERPESCPTCGALSVEFEWFGPFYVAPPEHIGQLSPEEIVTTLAMMPDQIAAVILAADDEVLRYKPAADEWCAKEVVGHLIETDVLFNKRVKVILEGQGIPAIPRTAPPWFLNKEANYETVPADELVERLKHGRSVTLELIRPLKPAQWTRQGTLLGTVTSVLDLGSWITNHDRGHFAHIRRLCRVD